MRILVTCASSFIGTHIVARLGAEGHKVVGCARDLATARWLLPDIVWHHADLNVDVTPEAWAPRLAGIKVVINCAGILQSSAGNDIRRVHESGPIALFRAAETAVVRRIIRISALGAGQGAGTAYAASKDAADRWLAESGLEWIVFRLSLVVGRDAYGGTALFRALAALPWILPLPGDGAQRFQPIAMQDAAEAVVRVLPPDAPQGRILDLAGPRETSLREILLALRQWLSLPPPLVVAVPFPLICFAARLAEWSRGEARWLGPYGHHSVSSPRSSNRTCGFPASGFPIGFTSKHTAVGQDGPDFVGSHRTPRTRPYRGNA